MKIESKDLKLGFASHALQSIKTDFDGKIQRIKVVVFWVRKISRQDSTP